MVAVSRDADHLPLYKASGGDAAAELAPVAGCWILLASTRLRVDETVVPVLDPGRGKTKIRASCDATAPPPTKPWLIRKATMPA